MSILPEDLTAESLLQWQAVKEDGLERALLAHTEEALSVILDLALSFSLTAASARHLWEEAVTRSLAEVDLLDDRLLLEDLLEAGIGDEALDTANAVLALQSGRREAVTQDELRAALEEALDLNTPSLVAAGWLAKILQPANKLGSTWKTRIKRQVRTGFTGLVGRLTLAEMRYRGIGTKTWVTKRDDRVRETHENAHGQSVPIDQPFRVGFEDLQYPGERGKPLGETANCRCVLVPAGSAHRNL